MKGLRLLKYYGLMAVALGCLFSPVLAQAAVTISADGTMVGATSFTQSDPAIQNAMTTLPDAVSKWRECYRGCIAQQECTARICAHECEGRVVASGYAASQTADMLRYNVAGIMGAECIGDFKKYIKTIQDAAKAAHLLGLSGLNILATVIVDKILDAVIGQILNNLTNQICNVTNQLTQAANSFVQNAICLPNVNINPFNFNLNIKNLQCDGFSINALTGQVNGAPVNGVNTGITNIYGNGTGSGAVTGSTGYTAPTVNLPQDLGLKPQSALDALQGDPITVPSVSTTP